MKLLYHLYWGRRVTTEPQAKGGHLLEVLGPGWELIGRQLSCEVVRRIMQDEPGPALLCTAVDGRC